MKDQVQLFSKALEENIKSDYQLDICKNTKKVFSLWCYLDFANDILAVARAVKNQSGRLSTITAYQVKTNEISDDVEIAYHFDLNGSTVTAIVKLSDGNKTIPSLTPVFRNADWNEREFMELYDLKVDGHPNPKKLFIDQNIDNAVLQNFIPYSAMVNAASTKTLWENIMKTRGQE